MIITTTKINFVFLLFLFVCFSCLKPVTFPNEPIIEYLGFVAEGDSGKISFSFTDGDGDIGLNQNQISPPFDTSSYYYYNLYINYYEMMNGSWVRATADPGGNNFPTADSITFSYRLENLTPTGQNKALRGDIEITMEPHYFNPISNHNDSIKFSILLIDRAQNHSNVIESPLIVR
ncbi:MAG: hypothetical protein P8L23_03670 [Flavobacteriales bacterium]|nr:hypothetical protein [Flavobacteriales bacterium]